MTEHEWLTSQDSRALLAFLHGPASLSPADIPSRWRRSLRRSVEAGELRASPRQLALFTAAAARLNLRHEPRDEAMILVERHMLALAEDPPGELSVAMRGFYGSYEAVVNRARSRNRLEQHFAEECVLLRDVVGNPFRGVKVDPAWLTPTVVQLARAASGLRLPCGEPDPERLFVLADALEEAGAANGLVDHLRTPGPHVMGCWVLGQLCQPHD